MQDPIMAKATVTINEETYTMRRLGIEDAWTIADIMGAGVAAVGGQVDESQTMQVLVASMAKKKDAVMDLIADVLSVNRETLADPERFPISSIITILQALAEHPDLKEFLEDVGKLTGSQTPTG